MRERFKWRKRQWVGEVGRKEDSEGKSKREEETVGGRGGMEGR